MLWQVDPSADAPLYEQLAASVRAEMAVGRLARGERLPSAKEVAAALDVNLHTVLRAYQLLRDEGRDNAEERAEAGSTRMRMDAFVTLVEAGVIPEDAIPSGWLEDGKLKDPSEFPADRAHVHAQGAENVVMEYAFTTPYDLSGAYRSSFESFYGPASKE